MAGLSASLFSLLISDPILFESTTSFAPATLKGLADLFLPRFDLTLVLLSKLTRIDRSYQVPFSSCCPPSSLGHFYPFYPDLLTCQFTPIEYLHRYPGHSF
jgi:hypothetical protein